MIFTFRWHVERFFKFYLIVFDFFAWRSFNLCWPEPFRSLALSHFDRSIFDTDFTVCQCQLSAGFAWVVMCTVSLWFSLGSLLITWSQMVILPDVRDGQMLHAELSLQFYRTHTSRDIGAWFECEKETNNKNKNKNNKSKLRTRTENENENNNNN